VSFSLNIRLFAFKQVSIASPVSIIRIISKVYMSEVGFGGYIIFKINIGTSFSLRVKISLIKSMY